MREIKYNTQNQPVQNTHLLLWPYPVKYLKRKNRSAKQVSKTGQQNMTLLQVSKGEKTDFSLTAWTWKNVLFALKGQFTWRLHNWQSITKLIAKSDVNQRINNRKQYLSTKHIVYFGRFQTQFQNLK